MTISQQFNKFYHGTILNDAFKKSRKISFREFKDMKTGTVFTIWKGEDYDENIKTGMDEFKQLFKILNLEYPNDESQPTGKKSTKDLTSKELSEHIEWSIKILSENGVELNLIREEWDRLMAMARE